jgi:hypothetical protein
MPAAPGDQGTLKDGNHQVHTAQDQEEQQNKKAKYQVCWRPMGELGPLCIVQILCCNKGKSGRNIPDNDEIIESLNLLS